MAGLTVEIPGDRDFTRDELMPALALMPTGPLMVITTPVVALVRFESHGLRPLPEAYFLIRDRRPA